MRLPMPELQPFTFTAEQRKNLKAVHAPAATEDQFNFFLNECERRQLVPGTHVVFSLRNAKEYNRTLQQSVDVQKVTLITTVNALRLIAERTGKFEGYGRFTYYYGDNEGQPTIKSEIPLGRVPHGVGVQLYRKGWREPVFAFARFDACVQTRKQGDKEVPNRMWEMRGEEQCAKCAEAFGLRMVAPEDCGGLYLEEEFARLDKDEAPQQQPTMPVAPVTVPVATQAPPVNQQPAMMVMEAPAVTVTTVPVPCAVVPLPIAPPVVAPAPVIVPPAPSIAAAPPLAPPVSAPPLVPTNTTPATPAPSIAPVVATVPTANPTAPPVGQANTNGLPTQAEYQTFLGQRASKIVRDKLTAEAKLKDAGNLMKAYLEKQGGAKLKGIKKVDFERILTALENASAADAAKMVQDGSK